MDQIPDLQQILRLAQSPAGKQLLKFLQIQGGNELNSAAELAAAGNYEAAKTALSGVMNQPEAKKLLAQLEEEK